VKSNMTIDMMDDPSALRRMFEIQSEALALLPDAFPSIAEAAKHVARVIGEGGRLIYCGAGSSGLIAVQDGAELPGTFGIDPAQIIFVLAGGLDKADNLLGHVEDDEATALREIEALGALDKDVMIAISASGSTPYTCAAARRAKQGGAKIIGIANRAGAPLLRDVDVSILVPTPEEAVTGSTRMAAGTIQKCILGLISTLAHARLGHVYRGEMVNLRADNAKLRRRAVDIVGRVTGASAERAVECLDQAGSSVKNAILLAEGAKNAEEARELLTKSGGQIAEAVRRLKNSPNM
jgi:N-acetylmuramic acid 6-phosphate etherase